MIDVRKFEEMVKGPGKYEGEGPEAAYYWEMSLEGFGGEVIADMEAGGFYAEVVVPTEEEADAFGLAAGVPHTLFQSEAGFVTFEEAHVAWIRERGWEG